MFQPTLSVPLFKGAELKPLSDGKMGATKERAARIKRALELARGCN
jgi:hypothetical protein